MKTAVFLLIGCVSTVMAQTPINQQVISSQPGYAVPGATNVSGSMILTNPAGGTFQIGELDAQLATLKAEVERTLPMLSAVVNQAGPPTTVTRRSKELANAAGNLIANALGHGTNANNTLPPGGTSPRMTNFASFLRSLVSTNTGGTGGVSFDPNTVSQLATLQNDLQPVLSILNNLNVASTGGTNQIPMNLNQPQGALTPTGR